MSRVSGGWQPIAAPVRNISQRGDDFADEEQQKSITDGTMKEMEELKTADTQWLNSRSSHPEIEKLGCLQGVHALAPIRP